MFTGIVKGLGTIQAIDSRQDFGELQVEVGDLVAKPALGNSVAINGVCLTITKINGSLLAFEVMQETLRLSNLGQLKVGDQVGIETPLRMGDELGGHLVQGHVDGLATITHKEQQGENTRLQLRVNVELGRQLISKGSITLDGVSLTICDPMPDADGVPTYSFSVWLLPLTLGRTTLGRKTVGEELNVEVDYLVKAILQRFETLQLSPK